MSDRVALLQEGQLLQVGTPDDLYTDPDSLNVARFIGSPEVNILPAQAVQGGFNVGEQFIPFAHDLTPRSDLFLGVRPEDLMIGGSQALGAQQMITLPVTHKSQEDLGGEIILHTALKSLPDVDIRARLQKAAGGVDANIRNLRGEITLAFTASAIRLFDGAGQRIRTDEGAVATHPALKEIAQ